MSDKVEPKINIMNQTMGGGVLPNNDDQRIQELFAKLSLTQKESFIFQAACFLEVQSWPASAPALPAVANL